MKIVFMGTPQAAVPTLRRILADGHEVIAVWTQPDRPSGRGRKLTASPVKEVALERGLIVHQPLKLKTKESIGLFKSHEADVAVVVAYGRILSESYVNAFPKGCINVHFSLLPKYRGAAPVNWAIANGETKTGVTTMQMDKGLDTGDILLQSKTKIKAEESAVDLMEKLSFRGAKLLSETLANYDKLAPIVQRHNEVTMAPLLSKEDGLIDWNLAADKIANQVRGFQPFPRSYSYYEGKKITIWKAKALLEKDHDTYGLGEIVMAQGNELHVNCGEKTILKIDELQLAGRRRITTGNFLNGVKLKVGEFFGKSLVN